MAPGAGALRRSIFLDLKNMKKFSGFVAGALVAMLACFAIFYLSGVVLDGVGIDLYASEADQQRNFNMFLATSAVCGIVGGFLLLQKLARGHR